MEALSERKLRPNVEKALKELQTNPELQPIQDPPLRKISSIQFGFLSPDEIKKISVCNITTNRITQPPTDGVYDERMGPSNSKGICATCNEDIRVCPGHFGYVELAEPIIHPLFSKFVVIMLNCICLKCSKLRMKKEEINIEMNISDHDRYISMTDRLDIIHKKCRNVSYCKECDFPHPTVMYIEGNLYKEYKDIKTAKNEDEEDDTPIILTTKGKKINMAKKSLMDLTNVRAILTKISQSDLEIMGFNPQTRTKIKSKVPVYTFKPEWLILTHLPVIPPISRPPDHQGDTRSDDDLTTSYADIVKFNENLKQKINKKGTEQNTEKYKLENRKNLQKHISALMDNSDGAVVRNSGKQAMSYKYRLAGKEGHIRGKLVGKRVDCSARTVITADPRLNLNQVGVPEEIAKTLSFPEKVTPWNINEMNALLEAGKINTVMRGEKIIKVSFLQQLQLERKIKLKYDDIVYRQLRDGDTVVFNRQPTLHRGSMMAHYVRVLPGKTFRLNLSVTTPYNADFDGRIFYCRQQEA